MLASDWYAERLAAKQAADLKLAELGLADLRDFEAHAGDSEAAQRIGLTDRLAEAEAYVARVARRSAWSRWIGTLGRQPLVRAGPIPFPRRCLVTRPGPCATTT